MQRKAVLLALTVVMGLGLALMTISLAAANGGPHGDYTPTTDKCAACHRAHTASGANLLLAESTYALCLTCHGTGSTGAETNVEDGKYEGTGGGALNGGGFSTALDPTDYSGYDSVSSSHDYTGADDQAWGYDTAGRGSKGTLSDKLDCASCHNPHGTDGYRLLVAGPTSSAEDYDSSSKDYTSEAWSDTKLNDFCASCHDAYHVTLANSGEITGTTGYGGDTSTFAHRVGMGWEYTEDGSGKTNPETGVVSGTITYTLPLAGSDVVCTTCHLPHGTAAAMTSYAAGTYDPPGSVGAIPSGDSALLRLDNRGVCEVCHQK